MVSDLNELLANYNDLKTKIETVENNVETIVNDKMSNYLLKNVDVKLLTITKNTTLTNNYIVTLPLKYQVSNNSLQVLLCGQVLVKDIDYVEARQRRRDKQYNTAIT
ncbi:MAG: hypothetical protein HFJ52_04000 [Clostridia bacterium]|jgi:hypothetical protein|nr:hypothetical protein [Clostridia bacterium]